MGMFRDDIVREITQQSSASSSTAVQLQFMMTSPSGMVPLLLVINKSDVQYVMLNAQGNVRTVHLLLVCVSQTKENVTIFGTKQFSSTHCLVFL